MIFFISESMNFLYQINNRENNILKIKQASSNEFIWVITQIHQDECLYKFVWEKMIEILEMKNDIRVIE